jgi:hypothetical protein
MKLLDLPPAHLAVVEAERVGPFRGTVQIGVSRRRRPLHNCSASRLRRERGVRVGLLPVPQRHAGQGRRYRHKPTHANRLAGGGGRSGGLDEPGGDWRRLVCGVGNWEIRG